VDRLGFGQGLGADEVEARENPSRLAAQMFIQPHNEAEYTSAVVTGDPDPADLLQSGGVHIRPHMAHSVVSLRCFVGNQGRSGLGQSVRPAHL
jgi:hypothetical protein